MAFKMSLEVDNGTERKTLQTVTHQNKSQFGCNIGGVAQLGRSAYSASAGESTVRSRHLHHAESSENQGFPLLSYKGTSIGFCFFPLLLTFLFKW